MPDLLAWWRQEEGNANLNPRTRARPSRLTVVRWALREPRSVVVHGVLLLALLAATGASGCTPEESADADAGSAGEAGSRADAGSCAEWETCSDQGGRGNVCGGVTADERFLRGSGFEAFDGSRVVGAEGYAVIEDGAFLLHLGSYSGCGIRPATYRIDVSANGHCDDDVDLVYTVNASAGPGDLAVSGDDPGAPATCSELPDGYDLTMPLTPECFPTCGAVRAGLFDDGDTPLATTIIYRDGNWSAGRGFAGALVPGQDYRLRYYWDPTSRGICSGSTSRSWQRTFTAKAELNRVTLAAGPGAPERSACF